MICVCVYIYKMEEWFIECREKIQFKKIVGDTVSRIGKQRREWLKTETYTKNTGKKSPLIIILEKLKYVYCENYMRLMID